MHTTRSKLWPLSPLTAEAAADSPPGYFANCVELMWTKCHRKRHVGEHSWVVTSALFPQQLLTLLRGSSKVKRMILASIEGAVQLMHMFQQDVETELQGYDGEPIRAAVLYEILANSIEAVREAAPEHCFMAVTELTPLDDVVTGPALRVIDIWTDSDVWGVLDEGCNATVCGSEWLARATENCDTIGYNVLKVSDEGRPFKGSAGMTNTKGSFRIPFALTFEDSKSCQV